MRQTLWAVIYTNGELASGKLYKTQDEALRAVIAMGFVLPGRSIAGHVTSLTVVD